MSPIDSSRSSNSSSRTAPMAPPSPRVEVEIGMAEREELLARRMRDLKSEVNARRRELSNPKVAASGKGATTCLTARACGPDPLSQSSPQSGSMSARSTVRRDAFGHLCWEGDDPPGANSSLGQRSLQYPQSPHYPESTHSSDERRPDEMRGAVSDDSRHDSRSPPSPSQSVRSAVRFDLAEAPDRFSAVSEKPLPKRQASEERLPQQHASKLDTPTDTFGTSWTQSPETNADGSRNPSREDDLRESQVPLHRSSMPGTSDEQCSQSRQPVNDELALGFPSAEREPLRLVPEPPSPKQFSHENSPKERLFTGAAKYTLPPGVQQEMEAKDDVDAEVTSQWMAGLRGSSEEKASDDPLVFGAGFKSTKRLSFSSDCDPWTASFHMGGQSMAPRKAKPALKARVKADAPKPEVKQAANPQEFREAKPEVKPESKPQERPEPMRQPPHTSAPQHIDQPRGRRAVGSQSRPQAAPQAMPQAMRRTMEGPQMVPQAMPQAMRRTMEAAGEAPQAMRRTMEAGGDASQAPVQPGSQARAHSLPRAGNRGVSCPRTRPQPSTGTAQNRTSSPPVPRGVGTRPARQENNPNQTDTAAPGASSGGSSYPQAGKASGRGGSSPTSAPTGPSHTASGGSSPTGPPPGPYQPAGTRASTAGSCAGRGRQPGPQRCGQRSTDAPRAKAEAGGTRPKPVPVTAKTASEASSVQGKLLQALKSQMTKLAKVRSMDDRKRHFIRLCFQWHPDKNPANIELATKGFQMLQEQKKKLLSS